MNSGTDFAGTDGWTTIMYAAEEIWVTGWKSRRGSYGSLIYTLGLIVSGAWGASSSVYPSGCALDATSNPTMPPALPRFSTMTGWPQLSVSFRPTSREMMSLGPPGTNESMIRIGRLG